MRRKSILVVTAFLILLWVLCPLVDAQDDIALKRDDDIRSLLSTMKADHRSTQQLAVLFQVGDVRIGDLIRALGDPDKDIKLSAQIVIRYLGNDQGLNAWLKDYESDKNGAFTGPIPIPLRSWDYEFIRTFYLRDNVQPEALMESFMFALALDNSPQATKLLSDVVSNAREHGFRLDESRYLGANQVIRTETDNDLAQSVLEKSTFLNPADRKYTSARLVAFTASKDKALIELYVNRGLLAKEWHHIVLARHGQNWKFFSITPIAVS